MSETFTWTAHYHDGTVLAECPDPGDPAKDNSFAAVDHLRLIAITLATRNPADPPIGVAVDGANGARGIFFRRRPLVQRNNDEPFDMPWTGTAVGFQKTINGRNTKAILWLGDDGRIVLTDRDIANLDQPLSEDES